MLGLGDQQDQPPAMMEPMGIGAVEALGTYKQAENERLEAINWWFVDVSPFSRGGTVDG